MLIFITVIRVVQSFQFDFFNKCTIFVTVLNRSCLLFPGGTPPKSRITKSNTMSNATGRSVLGQPNVDKRRSAFEATNRSAFEATKFSTSTDKADDDLESEFMNRFGLYWTNFLYPSRSLFK